jgi:hypothetical protein
MILAPVSGTRVDGVESRGGTNPVFVIVLGANGTTKTPL